MRSVGCGHDRRSNRVTRPSFDPVTATSAVDLVLVAYQQLTDAEQEVAFSRLAEIRIRKIAGTDSEFARHIRSLRRAAEHAGRVDLSVDEYRAAYADLKDIDGEEVIEVNKVIAFFGRWSRAKEALDLSAVATPLKIEARFRSRSVGKVHEYRDEVLGEVLLRCAGEIGHPPLVVEFENWRYREIELAKARGEELWLPSASPYRRRWKTWEGALAHFGFSEGEIAGRLEAGRERANGNLVKFQFARP